MEYRGAYRWAAVWIAFCVWCQCVPWFLGLFGQLNRGGYLAAILFTLPFLFYFGKRWKQLPGSSIRQIVWRWRTRALRQPVFGVWLLLFAAALIGGILYAPTNHDGLTYRFPRILHWFWEGRWHWIDSPAEPQMNLSTHGFEWLTGFLFALTGSDRLFFLINLVSFALLPGLLFGFLTRLGISGRVASWWMWIFPSGYGIALQAGSIGNDLFAIPYVLAGMVFALRARDSKEIGDVVLAILAAALVTGTKLSNAPLVLPIAVTLIFNLSWVLRWRYAPALLGATAAGLIASAAPVMLACTLYTGHFSGDPDNSKNLNVENPVAGVVANSLQVASRNLMPPVNPAANWWNRRYSDWLPGSLQNLFAEDYPRFHLRTTELPQEEGDGLGLGVTALVLLAFLVGLAGFRSLSRKQTAHNPRWPSESWIYLAVFLSALVYLVKMGSEAAPRLMLPYYSLLLVLVLGFKANRTLVRRRWWPFVSAAAAAFVLPALVLSPNRPLFPVKSILSSLPESAVQKRPLRRMATVYETYATRNDAMAPLRKHLSESAGRTEPIVFVGDGRSLRIGLWRPFGAHKVEHFAKPSDLVGRNFSTAVIDLSELPDDSVEDWATSQGLEVTAIEHIPNYAGKPPEQYAILVPKLAKLSVATGERDSGD